MKYEISNVKYEIWNLKYEIWNMKFEMWNLKYEIWNIKYEIVMENIFFYDFWWQILNMTLCAVEELGRITNIFREVLAGPIETQVDGGKCEFKARKI